MTRSWRLKPLAAAIVAAGALGSSESRAASLTVATLAESSGSACTLRDAIDSINAASDQGACVAIGAYGSSDTVSFTPGLSGTLTFFGNDPLSPHSALVVQRPTAIQGPGSTALTLACGSSFFRMMEIDAGAAAVELTGLSIVNCVGGTDGGAVLIDAQSSNVAMAVQFTDVTLRSNRSARGGGLAVFGGPAGATVTLTACDVRLNSALTQGGGLFLSDNTGLAGSTLTVSDSTVAANNAAQFGGGAFVSGGSAQATFTRTTIDANHAAVAAGVEINGSADVTLFDSTLSNNQAGSVNVGGGARLFGPGARFQAVNSTLSHNSAGRGGGVYAIGIGNKGLLSLANTTVANNVAAIGSGVMVENTLFGVLITPVVSFVDTIVAGNTPAPDIVSKELSVVGGVLPWDVSYSVIGDAGTVTIVGAGNITDGAVPPPFGASGWLGPLQNNGGPTQTHALLTTVPDPAIDAGDPAFSGLLDDQRGPPFKRVRNGRVDIGAFESAKPKTHAGNGPPAPVPGPGGIVLGLLSGLLGWLGWRLRPRR